MLRLDLKVTQVAKRAGLRRETLSRWLNRSITNPRISFIERVWYAIEYERTHKTGNKNGRNTHSQRRPDR